MAFAPRIVALALALTLAMTLAAAQAPAQEAQVAFGELGQDTTLPVEVVADTFSVNNADGTAIFAGNVRVTQGEMTLAAAEVLVRYSPDGNAIHELVASGGVMVTNLGDAAEAREAVYTIETGVIVLTGDVLLTQGPSSISGQELTINLEAGTGVMTGRVTTIFTPGGN